MIKLKIKGHDIKIEPMKDSFNRRSVQLQNKITATLHKIGVKKDQVGIELESVAGRKAKASATWHFGGHNMQYANNSQPKFVDNLQVVSKVIEIEVDKVLSGEKTTQEFTEEFREEEDIDAQRLDARTLLGIAHDSQDVEAINRRYREMAKELHPDTPTGNTEKFKELNKAHKILKRELS
ncbi:Chaperone protein DnaJ [uncultured archaeon]|nr:Chaperone protein DnaJ [uncultured archaeon]